MTTVCPPAEQWELYFRGEAPAERTASLRAHLECCESCQQWAGEHEETLTLLDDLRVVVGRSSAELADDLSGRRYARGARIGPYEIQNLLGVGGMAKVYRAVHTDTGLVVALKVLKGEYQASEEIRARFAREARTLAHMRHANIVRVYPPASDVADSDQVFIAMELLGGGTLGDWIARCREASRRPSERKVLALTLQAARGIGAAHAGGLVHRDVKPSNLLLDDSGRLKVSDFGVVQALDSTTWVTGTGQHIGTPAYMSPEQCKGERATPASDVYSLGTTMFELATGRLPFTVDGGSPFAQMLKHISEPAPDPRDFNPKVPGRLATVMLRCLEKYPPDRYADGAALSEALEEVSRPDPAADRPAPVALARDDVQVNVGAIREQLGRLPQRSIVAWACRCARRVQRLTADPRVSRAVEMAEAASTTADTPDGQSTSGRMLSRMQQLRAASLAAAYAYADVGDAAVAAARAAAATSACAAARCTADAAADAVFTLENTLIAARQGGVSATTCWREAQKDFRRLHDARLGAAGTIGLPIPEGFWP